MTLKALYAASTGMEAQQTRVNNIANNLANLNTVGFKASRENFEDLIYDQQKTPGESTGQNTTAPVGIQIGHGTQLVSIVKRFSQGEFVQSNRELDIALEGKGFFKLTMDDGTEAYTRDGSFGVNSDGAIVNNRGYILSPEITVPENTTSLSIAKDGTVSATVAGDTAASVLGNLTVSMFRNPAGLKSMGQNLYGETDASGTASDATPGSDGAGTLSQGFLENSNVNVAEELVNMIIAQRTYEANSRVMSTTSEMMRSTTSAV